MHHSLQLGELSSLILIACPLTAFLSCGKSAKESNTMLDKISINFLISLAMMNGSWMAYGVKIHSTDITDINTICTIASFMYVFEYLRIRYLLKVPWKCLIFTIGAVLFQILMLYGEIVSAD